jgi:hypothetical protein
MPIDVLCPGCGKTLRLGNEHAGKTGKCPACQTHFPIPPASSVAGDGFERLVSQLQPPSPPASTKPESLPSKTGLFGEGSESDAAPGSNTSKPVDANPYAAPYSTTPFQPNSGSSDASASVSRVLGILAILCATVGFCCCFISFLSYPLSIVGLVLAYQAPPQQRQSAIMLNVVGLILPTLSIVLGMFFLGFRKG